MADIYGLFTDSDTKYLYAAISVGNTFLIKGLYGVINKCFGFSVIELTGAYKSPENPRFASDTTFLKLDGNEIALLPEFT